METNGNDDFDFWITLENRESGTYSPGLTNWSTSTSLNDEQFPGVLQLSDETVLGAVSLSDLGDPDVVRICAKAESVTPEGTVTATDSAPAGDCIFDVEYATLEVPT